MAPRISAFCPQWVRSAPGRKWLSSLLLVTVALFVASWISLLDLVGIDTWLERKFFQLMDYSAPVSPHSSLRIVYIEESDTLGANGSFADSFTREAWRSHHAELLQALAAAGAKVVAFDIIFPEPAEQNLDADRKFAKAIQAVQQSGKTRVVLGDDPELSLSQALKDVITPEALGSTRIGGFGPEPLGSSLRDVLLAECSVPTAVVSEFEEVKPSLPLQVVLAWKSAGSTRPVSARFDAKRKQLVFLAGTQIIERLDCEVKTTVAEQIRRRQITMPLHQFKLIQIQTPSEKYVNVYKKLSRLSSDYRDKIVLIGARLKSTVDQGGEVVSSEGGAPVYGYEIHAAAMSQLLHGRYPRRLPAAGQFLALLLSCLVAGIGRRYLPKAEIEIDFPWVGKRKLPLALFVLLAAYAVAVVLFYRWKQVVFTPGYDLLGLILGYYVCGRHFLEIQRLSVRDSSRKADAV